MIVGKYRKYETLPITVWAALKEIAIYQKEETSAKFFPRQGHTLFSPVTWVNNENRFPGMREATQCC